jgi:tetratricopeptide (TPR) repeat protein
MNLLSGKTFSLLSIGKRGVGKTVFLAGSYDELHSRSQTDRNHQMWFDCQDTQAQENIEKILSYVGKTGQYPPFTIKITNFNFSLKRYSRRGVQTLSHFRWWDIPGESCNISNPDFHKIVFASQGCCVFIDAYALMHNNAYLQTLEDIIEQVMVIANIVYLNKLKYAFALILTKCDLLQTSPLNQQQLEKLLQPLIASLDAVRANYQMFYSFIPIVNIEGTVTLNATGAAAPLLWLVEELRKAHEPGLINNLQLLTRLKPKGLQPQQEEVSGSLQSLFELTDKAVGVEKKHSLYLFLTAPRKILLLALAILGLIGAIALPSVNYEWVFRRQSQNIDALIKVATLRQQGQFDQAVPLMEKIVQQQPKHFGLRLQLADLYRITGQVTKAEQAYDQVLVQQKDNFNALSSKALLRYAQGDRKTAQVLFTQAEKAAPADLKAQIREIAQQTLQTPAKSVSPAK